MYKSPITCPYDCRDCRIAEVRKRETMGNFVDNKEYILLFQKK